MVVINRLNPWLNKQSNRLSGWLAYEILKKFLVIVQPSFLSQRDTITTWIRDEQFEARHGSHKEDTNVYESAAVNLDSCDVFRSIQDPTAPQFPSVAAARHRPPPSSPPPTPPSATPDGWSSFHSSSSWSRRCWPFSKSTEESYKPCLNSAHGNQFDVFKTQPQFFSYLVYWQTLQNIEFQPEIDSSVVWNQRNFLKTIFLL